MTLLQRLRYTGFISVFKKASHMDNPENIALSSAQRKNQVLLQQLSGNNKKPLAKNPNDGSDLLQLASKKRSDNVKFTYFFLKNRLSSELDATITDHVKFHPEMKDQFFVGIITDQPFRTEVLKLSDVSQQISTLPEEEALEELKKNPVGYFESKDFPLKTPQSPEYQALQKKLNSFFEENSSVFQYLREHPEHNLNATDFYKPPS